MKTFTLLTAILFAVCLNNNYAQDTWRKKANFGGIARDGALGLSIGSKGYLGTLGFGTTKDFWEYDPATNAWTQKADFGGDSRGYAAGFSIGSKGYIGTGYNSIINFYKDFWEYDPAGNTWTRKADFGGTARHGAVGFSIGSKGYIGTGNSGNYEKDFWEYDPATDTWTRKADFGGDARVYATGFSIGNKGYLGTGSNSNFFQRTGSAGSLYKDFWEYDPATNTWTQKADFGGSARVAAVGFSIGGKGYLGTGSAAGSFFKDFWEYDPAANIWSQKADFGGGTRQGAAGFSIAGNGYLGTGYNGSYYRDFWEYTPENTCPAPTGLKVQDISDTSAILKWQVAGTDVFRVRVRYRAVGGTTWTIKNKQGDKPSVHIDELTPNTPYQWQTRSFCAEDTTGWIAGPDFTTAASLNPGTTATAYPNPAMNTVTVNYVANRNGKYIFEITNASGNVVLRKEANAIPGANRITIDISRFFKGVYFINIIKPDMTRETIQLNKK